MMTGSSGYKYFVYYAYNVYISIIVASITIMVGVSTLTSVYAITNSTSNVNKPLYQQIKALIENPYFAPDASCLFDAFQLHCIPGDHQECPEGFGQNEDGTCFAKTFINGTWKWKCPDEYYSVDEDETGQCYPDTKPCYFGQVRNQSDPADNSCSDVEHICEGRNVTGCVINGRNLADFPDEYCLTSPESDNCAIIPNFGCPDDFVQMNALNFTTPRCVPEDSDELELEERREKVFDPNRCAPGYKLDLPSHLNIWSEKPVGQCFKEIKD
jgi:hypothetical protein